MDRCETCKHWNPMPDGKDGVCEIMSKYTTLADFKRGDASSMVMSMGWLQTKPSFGCVSHEYWHYPNRQEANERVVDLIKSIPPPIATGIHYWLKDILERPNEKRVDNDGPPATEGE